MANTTHYNLPYPDDYNAVADVPLAVKNLAEATDTTIYTLIGDLDTILQSLDSGGGVE